MKHLMPAMPAVSVVISVHEDVRFLDEAIDSVLSQTMSNFELLIVDDGSPHRERLHALSGRDRRIRLIVNDRNLGLTASLNRAISVAQAGLIARMDSDDVSLPTRLATQHDYLLAQPTSCIVGCRYVAIDSFGRSLHTVRLPESDAEIRWTALFSNPFCHPATMFRISGFRDAGRYDERLTCAQDYDLWARMLQIGRGYNLPAPLLHYRLNERGITATRRAQQEVVANGIRQALWNSCSVSELEAAPLSGAAWRFQAGVPTSDPDDACTLAFVLLRLLNGLAEREGGHRAPFAAVARRILWTWGASLGRRSVVTRRNGRRALALAARFDFAEAAACLVLGRSHAAKCWTTCPSDFEFASMANSLPGTAAPWASLAKYEGVWIYGTGNGGRMALQILRWIPGCRIAGFVDSVQKGECEGLPLVDRSDLLALPAADQAVIVASGAWQDILVGFRPGDGRALFIADVEGDLRLYRIPIPKLAAEPRATCPISEE